ncbi:type IX secretion system membrane protein, PorP/SprF family [Pedobacter insulae]|uniref:Type IX secretion system membrane protein, PorP/SprF family n=2 Tax=Pedobacter insulae TaxID=414048 RepID=A0A1I3AFD6_9SPHI|nr:type IX secretion system membrane protein, PorP/SprF family [Pedobacter insulae]
MILPKMKMMKYIKIIILAICLCFGAGQLKAQIDPHYSQYYANPLWLNPALTGITDGEYRVNINAKQQWSTVGKGFLTAGASFDTQPTKNLSFGAMIINQNAGEISYNQLNALVSGAYQVKFGKNGEQVVSFGLQAGIINKSFDPSKITLGSQFNPITGYDPSMPFNENFGSTNYLAPDINTGVMFFDAAPNQKVNVFAGAAFSHLTRPKDKFIGGDAKMPMRFTGHGGARVMINHMLDITPNFIYLKQGQAEEIAAGAYAKLMLNPENDLIFGASYRVDDAAIAFLGMQIKNMVIGASYDFNTSQLNRATSSKGGFELSVSFTSRKRGEVGPNFFCPRL